MLCQYTSQQELPAARGAALLSVVPTTTARQAAARRSSRHGRCPRRRSRRAGRVGRRSPRPERGGRPLGRGHAAPASGIRVHFRRPRRSRGPDRAGHRRQDCDGHPQRHARGARLRRHAPDHARDGRPGSGRPRRASCHASSMSITPRDLAATGPAISPTGHRPASPPARSPSSTTPGGCRSRRQGWFASAPSMPG